MDHALKHPTDQTRAPESKPAQGEMVMKPTEGKEPDIAAASIPDTLAMLKVNPDIGLTGTELEARYKEHGCKEVTEQKGHPVIDFL